MHTQLFFIKQKIIPTPKFALTFTLLFFAIFMAFATSSWARVDERLATAQEGLSAFDQTNAVGGQLLVDSANSFTKGQASFQATYTGKGSNGYSRGIFETNIQSGEDFYYASAFYLPVGFHNAMQSETDIMRHDNFGLGQNTDYGGIGIMNFDKKAHLYKVGSYQNGNPGSGSGQDLEIIKPFQLPEGRWFWLEVHQKLSSQDGQALNQVWLDGKLVGESTKANSFGLGVTRVRYGIVSIGQDTQTQNLNLNFDNASISQSPITPQLAQENPKPPVEGEPSVLYSLSVRLLPLGNRCKRKSFYKTKTTNFLKQTQKIEYNIYNMALSQKAYKQRAYPSPEQRVNLSQTFGCARLAYNLALADRKQAWDDHGKSMGASETMRKLVERKQQEQYSFLQEVSSAVLQQAAHHVQDAYQRYWKGQTGFPRFKKKGKTRDSATYPRTAFTYQRLEDGTALVKLAKQSEPLKIIWDRALPIDTTPSKIVVSRDRSNRYFVSLLFEEDIQPLPKAKHEAIGLDLGLKAFYTDDRGNKIKHPKPTKVYEKKLARAQRELARKVYGSQNWYKTNQKVNRIHAKIADIRRDFAQQESTRIVRENQTICVETLKVKNMMQNHKLAKAIQDVGWSMFLEMLEYKARWYGRELVKLSQWEPTTQRCHGCKALNKTLCLKDRYWDCPGCGAHHDRDVNAAKNIRTAGLAGIVCGAVVSQKPSQSSKKKVVGGAGNSVLKEKQKTLEGDLKKLSS